jgi:hypothetical protein
MRKWRRLNINTRPARVEVEIPLDLPAPGTFIRDDEVKDICRRHSIPRERSEEFQAFLFCTATNYLRLKAMLPQHPMFQPLVASRKDAEALFSALGTFLELFTSPSMVPRILHALQENRSKCAPEDNIELYEKTANELEMLLVALNSTIDYDGREFIAHTKMKHALRFTAKRLLNFWHEALGRSGSLSRRSGEGTALGFVLECLGLITGEDVSEHAIRGIDKMDEPLPKRKRTRVRRLAAA